MSSFPTTQFKPCPLVMKGDAYPNTIFTFYMPSYFLGTFTEYPYLKLNL